MNLIGAKDAAVLETAIRWLRFMDFAQMIYSGGLLVCLAPPSSIPTYSDLQIPNFLSNRWGSTVCTLLCSLRIKNLNCIRQCSSNKPSRAVFPPGCTINASTQESSCQDNKGHVHTKAAYSETDHFLNCSKKKKKKVFYMDKVPHSWKMCLNETTENHWDQCISPVSLFVKEVWQ